MGSSVGIREQSKSPLSRACSRCPFHLFRAHWPPIAHVQCRLSCTHKEVISDPGNEMQFFAYQIAFLLTYRAVPNRSSQHTDSQKTKPCAVCSGTEKEVNPGLSLVMALPAFGKLCLLSPWSSHLERTCSLLLLSVLSARYPGASFSTLSSDSDK